MYSYGFKNGINIKRKYILMMHDAEFRMEKKNEEMFPTKIKLKMHFSHAKKKQ